MVLQHYVLHLMVLAAVHSSYGINLGEAQENDVTETVNGIQVAMDPKVVEIVNTLTLDYVEDQQGAYFVISGGSNCC